MGVGHLLSILPTTHLVELSLTPQHYSHNTLQWQALLLITMTCVWFGQFRAGSPKLIEDLRVRSKGLLRGLRRGVWADHHTINPTREAAERHLVVERKSRKNTNIFVKV